MDNTTQDIQDIELLVDNLRYHLGAEAVGNEYSFYERDKAIEIIEAYVTTRVKEAERLARIDELRNGCPRRTSEEVTGNWETIEHRHIQARIAELQALTTTTNGEGE